MYDLIEKVIRDCGNIYIEPALYGGDILVGVDFPCYSGLNNATDTRDGDISYDGNEIKDMIEDICSPGDIYAISVEEFLRDYSNKEPAFLYAKEPSLEAAFKTLEHRLFEWYQLTDDQQKDQLLSFAKAKRDFIADIS